MTRLSLFSYVALIAIAGCSSGPAVAPVKGRVTLAGKPLPPCEGRITFHPKVGRLATAPLETDGTFVLTTFKAGDGAIVGPHTVTIKATKIVNAPVPKSLEEELQQAGKKGTRFEPKIVWIVPQKYVDEATTTLTAVVERKDNVIDFDVTP